VPLSTPTAEHQVLLRQDTSLRTLSFAGFRTLGTAPGSHPVEKWRSALLVTPPTFCATKRKWYTSPKVSPETVAETGSNDIVAGRFFPAVRDPYAVVGPYSKYQVVSEFSGPTKPCSATLVPVIADVEPPPTAGRTGGVLKVWSEP
jgi:hypothetical protein